MWKNRPQPLWKSDCLADSSVDSVENLSTDFVEKSAVRRVYVDDVEKLSTGIVDNSLMFLIHMQTPCLSF